MWNRQILKEEAKKLFTFKDNYWKMVLVGLVLILLTGGIAGSFGGVIGVTFGSTGKTRNNNVQYYEYTYRYAPGRDYDISEEDIEDYLEDRIGDSSDKVIERSETPRSSSNALSDLFAGVTLGVAIAIAILVSLITLAISFGVKAFVVNPIVLGGKSFFLKSYERPSDLKDLGNGFKNSYLGNVKTLFMRDIFVFLWSLLFVIPGIIKAYEYRMIPFLLAENPNMTSQEAFAKSKEMMMGNKWNAFVYDLSFLGWFILNSLTCGILGLFYVNPYYYAADANLYRAIKMGGSTGYVSDRYRTNPQPMQGAYTTQQQAPMQGQAMQQPEQSPQQAPSQGQAVQQPEQTPQQAPMQGTQPEQTPVSEQASMPEQQPLAEQPTSGSDIQEQVTEEKASDSSDNVES